MSRSLKETSQFKTDKKRIKKSGRDDWEKMRAIVKELINDRPLDAKHRDHMLTGEYAGVMECHIEPDWLLIYNKDGTVSSGALKLIRTGTHGEIFDAANRRCPTPSPPYGNLLKKKLSKAPPS